MDRKLYKLQWIGFFITGGLGVLLHFLYDWFPGPLVAFFSGVNESTWEHMKLLFWPLFLVALGQAFLWKQKPETFWCIKLKGCLLGLALIPIIFYTFNGAFGKSPDWYNITIFFQAAAATFLWETAQLKEGKPCGLPSKYAFSIWLLLAAAFILFTFNPPMLPLFQDPIDGSFGING